MANSARTPPTTPPAIPPAIAPVLDLEAGAVSAFDDGVGDVCAADEVAFVGLHGRSRSVASKKRKKNIDSLCVLCVVKQDHRGHSRSGLVDHKGMWPSTANGIIAIHHHIVHVLPGASGGVEVRTDVCAVDGKCQLRGCREVGVGAVGEDAVCLDGRTCGDRQSAQKKTSSDSPVNLMVTFVSVTFGSDPNIEESCHATRVVMMLFPEGEKKTTART
jgi:hypothetical protein